MRLTISSVAAPILKKKLYKSGQRITPIHRVPRFCHQCAFKLRVTWIAEENEKRLFCSRCGHISYLNPLVVAGTIPERDGKVLLLGRGIEPKKNFWTFPAGFVELGESAPDGAIRETLEEKQGKDNN